MRTRIFILLIAFSIQASYGQEVKQNNSGGTWVVESNIRTPRLQVIKFYNSSSELIYEESVTHRKIRYEKDRIKQALNKTLLIALEKDRMLKPGTFAALLKAKKLRTF